MKKIKKYPRKLKKGMRAVMNGKPKTKWQRKGVLVWKRVLFGVSQLAAAIATSEMISHDTTKFKPGGFVARDSSMMTKAGECVVKSEGIRFREDGKLDIKTDKGIFEGCSLHINKEPETMWTL